jgi:bifunctional NMN adenylyltransferase/nudix hydrolase
MPLMVGVFMKFKDYDVGVIVGRFQIAELHEAHKAIIEEVMTRHKKCNIFIGVSPTLGTKESPLDFASRKFMIQKEFHEAVITPILDNKSDIAWSKELDRTIRAIFPIGSVCLYGGRDSFLRCYHGNFEAREFPASDYRPATDIRAEIGKEIKNCANFRKGIIYSTQNQYPRVHSTVDIAIVNEREEILLATKDSDQREDSDTVYRFVGGFVDAKETLENAAKREAEEETGIYVGDDLIFLGSFIVEDWRYRNSSDSILTSFFLGQCVWGGAKTRANDDIDSVVWVTIKELKKALFAEGHRPLAERLITYIDKNKERR